MGFFFQAEDGIRDYKVTGVQTCALPIYSVWKKSDLPCGSRENSFSCRWIPLPCPIPRDSCRSPHPTGNPHRAAPLSFLARPQTKESPHPAPENDGDSAPPNQGASPPAYQARHSAKPDPNPGRSHGARFHHREWSNPDRDMQPVSTPRSPRSNPSPCRPSRTRSNRSVYSLHQSKKRGADITTFGLVPRPMPQYSHEENSAHPLAVVLPSRF